MLTAFFANIQQVQQSLVRIESQLQTKTNARLDANKPSSPHESLIDINKDITN